MKLISLDLIPQKTVTGRLSDGSDRVEVDVSFWRAVVLDDGGRERVVEFEPNGLQQPQPQAIIDRLPRPTELVPTSKADLAAYALTKHGEWWALKTTRDEMDARGFATGTQAQKDGRTFIIAQMDAAWTRYLTALSAWRQAP